MTTPSPLDNVGVGDVLVTRPKTQAERGQMVGKDWGAVAVVSVFHDANGRKWGVGVPMAPTQSQEGLLLSRAAKDPSLNVRMKPDPRSYAFVPLFDGPAPYKTISTSTGHTAALGVLEDPFAARALYSAVHAAWKEGIEPLRIGGRDEPRAPSQTDLRPVPQARTAPTPSAHQPTAATGHAGNQTPQVRTEPDARSENFGRAKAAAVSAVVPPPSPQRLDRVAQAYALYQPYVTPNISVEM